MLVFGEVLKGDRLTYLVQGRLPLAGEQEKGGTRNQ